MRDARAATGLVRFVALCGRSEQKYSGSLPAMYELSCTGRRGTGILSPSKRPLSLCPLQVIGSREVSGRGVRIHGGTSVADCLTFEPGTTLARRIGVTLAHCRPADTAAFSACGGNDGRSPLKAIGAAILLALGGPPARPSRKPGTRRRTSTVPCSRRSAMPPTSRARPARGRRAIAVASAATSSCGRTAIAANSSPTARRFWSSATRAIASPTPPISAAPSSSSRRTAPACSMAISRAFRSMIASPWRGTRSRTG